MTIRQLLFAGTSLLSLSALPCLAGPCTDDIKRVQFYLDGRLNARAATAPSVSQSTGAQLHRQPTTNSKIKTELELGVLTPETVDKVSAAMARARSADSAGDKKACDRALDEARAAIGP